MRFVSAPLEQAGEALPARVHLVTALHACDTATDDAILLALRHGADHVAVVPCCQAEVAEQLSRVRPETPGVSPELRSLHAHPWHRRELGSHLTNVTRALALEASGHRVTVTELAGWEHSLKNELILGQKMQGPLGRGAAAAGGAPPRGRGAPEAVPGARLRRAAASGVGSPAVRTSRTTSVVLGAVVAVALVAMPAVAFSAPSPSQGEGRLVEGRHVERVTFEEAMRRARSRSTDAVIAAAEVRRAQALLGQVRSSSLPFLSGSATATILDSERRASPTSPVSTPRSSLEVAGTLELPLLAPSRWAAWSQAREATEVARVAEADVQRAAVVTAARAYLAVLSQRRLVEVSEVARALAAARARFASQRRAGGLGTAIDVARADQQLAASEAQLATGEVGLVRAQEALGIATGSDAPLDAAEEPDFRAEPAARARRRRVDEGSTPAPPSQAPPPPRSQMPPPPRSPARLRRPRPSGSRRSSPAPASPPPATSRRTAGSNGCPRWPPPPRSSTTRRPPPTPPRPAGSFSSCCRSPSSTVESAEGSARSARRWPTRARRPWRGRSGRCAPRCGWASWRWAGRSARSPPRAAPPSAPASPSTSPARATGPASSPTSTSPPPSSRRARPTSPRWPPRTPCARRGSTCWSGWGSFRECRPGGGGRSFLLRLRPLLALIAGALAFRFACFALMTAAAVWAERQPAPGALPDLALRALPYVPWVARANYLLWLAAYLPLTLAFLGQRARAAGCATWSPAGWSRWRAAPPSP